MKDLIYKKLIKYFILFSPIIDMITSYMYYHDYKLTIGLIIKGIVLLLAVYYLVIINKEKRSRNIIYLSILLIFSIINIYINMDIIKISGFSYFSFLFKYLYYLIMLLFFIRWYHNYNIKLSELRIPILIISLATILSVITNTAYISYQNNPFKEGFSLWYSSANELGNILCLLFPVAIYNALHNKDGIRLDLYLIPLCGATLLILGTKVGLLGYFLIIFSYLFMRLLFIRYKKLDTKFILMLMLFLIPLMFYKYLPGVFNINVSIISDQESNTNLTILNGRDDVKDLISDIRKNESTLSKIFGKTHYGEIKDTNQIILVEQDFIDVYFMYGYIGLLFILYPIILLYIKFIKEAFAFKKKGKVSKKYLAIIIGISLLLMVSYISGHTILTPSVSTYLVLLIALLFNIEFNNKNRNKKTVLISNIKDNKKLQDKYELIVLDDKKVIKNKLFAYLTVKNIQYDYVVQNDLDNEFVKVYLKYSNGKHVNYNNFR